MTADLYAIKSALARATNAARRASGLRRTGDKLTPPDYEAAADLARLADDLEKAASELVRIGTREEATGGKSA